jgi:glucose/arabinose dehydrogenase
MPAIAVSGMAFYTGDRFALWKGNVFVGAMRMGEIPGTGHLERIVLNPKGEELRRELMLTELFNGSVTCVRDWTACYIS